MMGRYFVEQIVFFLFLIQKSIKYRSYVLKDLDKPNLIWMFYLKLESNFKTAPAVPKYITHFKRGPKHPNMITLLYYQFCSKSEIHSLSSVGHKTTCKTCKCKCCRCCKSTNFPFIDSSR